MEVENFNITFTDFGSPDFEKAVDIRHATLFEEHGLSREAAIDDLDENVIHCLGKHEDEVVAYGRLFIEGTEGKISQMCVKESWQKRGVGKQVVLALIAKAKENKLSLLSMYARSHVLGFYERLGFHAVGEEFTSERTKIPHRRMIMVL